MLSLPWTYCSKQSNLQSLCKWLLYGIICLLLYFSYLTNLRAAGANALIVTSETIATCSNQWIPLLSTLWNFMLRVNIAQQLWMATKFEQHLQWIRPSKDQFNQFLTTPTNMQESPFHSILNNALYQSRNGPTDLAIVKQYRGIQALTKESL